MTQYYTLDLFVPDGAGWHYANWCEWFILKCILFTYVEGGSAHTCISAWGKFIKNPSGKVTYKGCEVDSWLNVDEDNLMCLLWLVIVGN